MIKLDAKNIISKYLKSKVFGTGEIKEEELAPILREIRVALLNADVNLKVIKSFFEDIKEELLVNKNYTPGDNLDVIVFSTIKKKLIKILGKEKNEVNFSKVNLNKILVVGLNGSGKTTTTAKVANYLKNKYAINVKTISLDIYRPGAFEQLKQLTEPKNIPCLPTYNNDFKKTIKNNIELSSKENTSCLIFDNYGLLPDNEQLIDEVVQIKKLINPTEVLFVLDAMSGQEALDTVRLFHEKLNITGIAVSKTDSNSPMGAVFSIAYLLKLPIKLMGTGEGIDDITQFHPERIAGSILGEGDILSLAEKMEKNVDVDDSKRLFMRIMSGNFDLEDMVQQIKTFKKLGSLQGILKLLPVNLPMKDISLQNSEEKLMVWEILINSMTKKERRNPKIFKKQPSRKARVIRGSGRSPDELNKLLKKYEEAKKRIDEMSSSIKRGRNPFGFLPGIK